MNRLIDWLVYMLTPVNGRLPDFHPFRDEGPSSSEQLSSEDRGRLMTAIKEALIALDVGRVQFVIRSYGHRLGLPNNWPDCIERPIVDSVAEAFHTLHRPDIALALARGFHYDPELWPMLKEQARQRGLSEVELIRDIPRQAVTA